jgi:hypothetical protein
MFKGKKGIYILIPLNIIIWSFFIYRFYTMYTDQGEIEASVGEEKALELDAKDSINYTLSLAYEDPFLKKDGFGRGQEHKAPTSPPKGSSIKGEFKIAKPRKDSIINMPNVKYLGIVRNNTSGSVTAIISINGSSKLIKQDETIEGLCFKNFTPENLTVLWKKEKIIISK